MNGIVLIDKEKNVTSRDVVNKVSNILKTKRVGHTGTLDPLATGLLVLCINEGCKLVELLTNHDKDYIAKVKMGVKTDTYDITGNIIDENYDYILTEEELNKTLKSFLGEYNQKVPVYSAVKVNGKKLYEYALNGISVEVPIHKVQIYKIKLLEYSNDSFTFFVTVSSGTYIRSLINDIGEKLHINMTMEELRRTRVGHFDIKDASSYDDIRIIPIQDALKMEKIELDDNLYKKVINGAKISDIYSSNMILFIKNGKAIAIYKKDNNKMMRLYRKFNL